MQARSSEPNNNYFLKYYELVLSRLLSNQTKLYPHQKEALLALHQKASQGKMDEVHRQAGLILAGVGTGKTLIQTVTPYLLAPWMKGRTALFLSDNCTLRARFLKDFPTTPKGLPVYSEWLLYSLDILPPGVPPPRIVELDTNNFNNYAFKMHEADMLVGNRQFLINLVARGDIDPDSIGLIVVDEAHFAAAASYQSIINYFDRALLTYFTGSKFRSDSQPMPKVEYETARDEKDPSVIKYAPKADYEFTLQDAWKLDPPPIKQIAFKEAHSGQFLVEEDGVEHKYDFKEFIAKANADKFWFRKILLADSFCLPVLDKAVEILLTKREKTGQPHAMIVRALNIEHVHRVASLLEEKFPHLAGKVGKIHSKHNTYDTQGRPNDLVKKFYDGKLWILVHCGTIGVGFDHKWASVSCCLCVFRTNSPAEQEWGRIIRKVPGPQPIADNPELDAPNWGVIVTHAALKIKPLFLDFYNGKKADIIIETPTEIKARPVITTNYEAGETMLKLSDTKHLRPGDVLELSILEDRPAPINNDANNGNGNNNLNGNDLISQNPSTSDSVLDSIANIDPEFIRRIEEAYAKDAYNPEISEADSNKQLPFVKDPQTDSKNAPLPWEKEAQAISDNLNQIKQTRTFKIQVESVLDGKTVQVVPTWNDIPTGALVDRTRRTICEPNANFIDHLNLDWQIMVEGELISYSEYKKRVVLETKGLQLNEAGEICANGVSLKLTLPPAAYDMFLKGLETEIAETVVEVPHSANAVARPDLAQKSLSEKYGGQIRGLIYDVLKNPYLIKDGGNGKSLISAKLPILTQAIERAKESGNNVSFKNNSQLIHSAVFGYIKDKTGKSFAEHSELEYLSVKNLVRQYLGKLQLELHRNRKN